MSDEECGFGSAERAAIEQRKQELRALEGLAGVERKAHEYEACLAIIDSLRGTDRAIAETLHLVVMEEAPHLDPTAWYGFPAYAKDGKVIVFFQPVTKSSRRYGSIGFRDPSELDDGEMWPTVYAVTDMTDEVEQRLRRLVHKAAGSAGTPTTP